MRSKVLEAGLLTVVITVVITVTVTSLTAKEKRRVIATALDKEFSEENCVLFLGM